MASFTAFETLLLATTTYATISGGQAESANLKQQAQAEETNARTREIERKRNLIKSLAFQNVRAGASGVTSGTGSSAQAIQLEDISREGLDELTDKAATQQRVSQLRSNARTAKKMSLLSAGAEGLNAGARSARRGTLKQKGAAAAGSVR